MCAFCGNDHGNGSCPWVPDEHDYDFDDDQGRWTPITATASLTKEAREAR
jgi:hypothetical protein